MPLIVIVAGPNGTGKSTWIQGLRKGDDWRDLSVVNADQVEVSHTLGNAATNFEKGREAVRQLRELVAGNADYLDLATVEESIARVRDRVSKNGHNIPEQDLRRRFPLSKRYLEELYKPIVDSWAVYELHGGQRVLVDFGALEGGIAGA